MINKEPESIQGQDSPPETELQANYTSPYWEYCKQKSNELGKGSASYPHTIETNMNDKKVEFNGMFHTDDPQNESLVRLEARFTDFIAKSDKTIVFVEGGVREVDGLTRDEAIAQSSESGLMCKLALDNNIKLDSPEPREYIEVQELLKLFTPAEIMQYYFSRTLSQWYRNKANNPNLGTAKEYVENRMKKQNNTPGLNIEVTSYDYFANKFAEKYGFRPEEIPEEIAREKLMIESSPHNPISAASGDIRDRYIFEQIQKATKDGYDVFVVFGSHHAFVFEQMLTETFSE